MHLVERLWATVTSIIGIGSLAPGQDGVSPQSPLKLPSETVAVMPTPVSANVTVETIVEDVPAVDLEPGPIFVPPGTKLHIDEPFLCDYSAMVGWEACSNASDRECWLRRKSDGKQFDVFTDYENEKPVGTTRRYNITLDQGWYDADGMNFTAAKLFDNKYPGTWIQACWGDTVIVNVTNKLEHNGTSIHWHGIRQNQTMHMDGVNGVTQCPIKPNDYFVYKFNVTQYGSSWYHSHYSVQYADGAVGAMTLHGPTSAEWDEALSPPLILTDWGHKSAFVALYKKDLWHRDILLNGKGDVRRYDNTAQNTSIPDPPYHITFEPPKPGKRVKKYLLRIINTSFDTTFVLSIDNHRLQIVSTDFVPIHPYSGTSVLVGIGQRYNVIVEALPLAYNESSRIAPDGNYWIRTWEADCGPPSKNKPSDGYEKNGILRYDGSSKAMPSTDPWPVSLHCSDEEFAKLHPILPWKVGNPANVVGNDTFDLWGDFAGKYPKPYPMATWTLTSHTKEDYTPMRVNYTNPTFLNLDNEGGWDDQWRIVSENYTSKDWIYLVIKGQNNGAWGAHPIHLHGHDFALLEQAYNKNFSSKTLNLRLDNPPRRDVVLMPKNGYVVIAFKADNPGAWLIHCHIAFHISEGLGLQILEDRAAADKIWPKKTDKDIFEAQRVCKNWNTWYSNETNWAVKPKIDCKDTKDKAQCFQDDSGI